MDSSMSYLSSDEEDEEDDEDETEDSATSDSDDSSSQYNASTHHNKLEDVCLGSEHLTLPQGLCESHDIFSQIFSLDTWNNVLTPQQRENLQQYLPSFSEDDAREKETTISNLFSGANFKFGNPLTTIFTQLNKGYLRPDIAKMKTLMKKAQHREYRYWHRRQCHKTLQSLLVSRRRLLSAASSQPPDATPRVDRIGPPPQASFVEQRSRRRYFEELSQIRRLHDESSQSSEDDNYPEGPPPRLSKKQKKQLSSMELSITPDLNLIPSTLSTPGMTPFQSDSQLTYSYNPYEITEESYRNMLINHRKKRINREDYPELNVNGITIQDVAQRSQTSRRAPSRNPATPNSSQNESRPKKKIKVESGSTPPISFMMDAHNSPSIYSEDSCSLGFAEVPDTDVTDKPPTPVKSTVASQRRKSVNNTSPSLLNIKEEIEDRSQNMQLSQTIEKREDSKIDAQKVYVTRPFSLTTQTITTSSINFQNLSTADIVAKVNANRKVDLPKAIKREDCSMPSKTKSPVNSIRHEMELNQETHVCFLSLLRDIICSTPDQRMGLEALEQKLKAWQGSPISALNDWYLLAPSWVSLLPSAVNFLTGDSPAETQPEDFVPYLEYKPHMQAYQWIGAGRDSDHHLAPLCSHWLDKRNEVPTQPVREEEHVEEPCLFVTPPPRCPTTWKVRKAVGAEIESFHQQEKRRYESPHRAFTYRLHGYESVVSPVKGAYAMVNSVTKARGHTLLVPDRPNYVTILSLVRDAVARLPNGEGSRADICDLLRDSQYLVQGAEDNYLQSVVGGALDRLHFETDTCVKYDPKRKIWVYLHRNRSEEEFEKIHQQQSMQPKTKRQSTPRKPANRAKAKDKEVKPVQVVTTMQVGRLHEAATTSSLSPTHPTAVAPVKASPVGTSVPRAFALSGGIQNLQVATSCGIQTIQVSSAQTVMSGASLLSTSAGQTVKLTPANTKKLAANLAALTPAGLAQQALSAARIVVSSSGITGNKTATIVTQSPSQQMSQTKVSTAGAIIIHPSTQAVVTTTSTTSTPLALHSVASQTRTITTPASNKAVLTNTGQIVNVSQMQLVNAARAMQQQQQQQSQLQLQAEQLQKQRLQQAQKKRQIQQIQLQLQQRKKQFLDQERVATVSSVAAGMKFISAQTAVKNLTAAQAGTSGIHNTQTIFIKHSAVGNTQPASTTNATPLSEATLASNTQMAFTKSQVSASSQGSPIIVATTSTPGTVMTSRSHEGLITTSSGKPMVAKVLSSGQGQLITMESLAGAVRVSGGKASLIQLPSAGGVPQFAMVAPGNIIGPRILQAAAQQLSQQSTTQTKQPPQNLRLVSQASTTPSAASGAPSLNVTTIGGQPVILASKSQGAMSGQNVFLANTSTGGPAVVLASPTGLRTPQGGTLLLQPGSAQPIMLPPGFQAGTLNLKSLQGIRVIPLSQATAAAAASNTSLPKGRPQVYARIITPPNRAPATAATTNNSVEETSPDNNLR